MYHIPAASHPDTAGPRSAGRRARRHPFRPSVQRPGRQQEGGSGGHAKPGTARPGRAGLVRRSCARSNRWTTREQAMLKIVEGLIKEPPTKEEVDRVKTRLLKQIDLEMTNYAEHCPRAERSDLRGRLAPAVLLAATNSRRSPRRMCCAWPKPICSRPIVPWASSSRPRLRSAPRFAAAPNVTAMLKDYKGGETISQGEAFDTSPANIESRADPRQAAQRDEAGAAAEEESRRHGDGPDRSAVRRREVACSERGGGRDGRRRC